MFDHASFDIPMIVPAVRSDLHAVDQHGVTNTALRHSSRKQALATKRGCFGLVQPIEFSNVFGFIGQVDQFRSTRLHTKRQFVSFDSGFQWIGNRERVAMAFIQPLELVKFPPLLMNGNSLWP